METAALTKKRALRERSDKRRDILDGDVESSMPSLKCLRCDESIIDINDESNEMQNSNTTNYNQKRSAFKSVHSRSLNLSCTNLNDRIAEADTPIEGVLGDKHAYEPIVDDDFDNILSVLFNKEANDPKVTELIYFRTDCEIDEPKIFGCSPAQFENLVVNYFELNGRKYSFSSQTTSLAIQYYIRYTSSIAARLKTEKDMSLPPWFFILAAIACQRLAIKFEEGHIEDITAIQMVSSDSSTEDDASCTEHFENLNGEGYVFTSEMIVWTEGLILNELKWDMNVVTPSSYINAMMYKLCQKNKKEDNKFFLPNIEYVQFVLEAARKDISMNTEFRPSVVAASAIVVAIEVVKSLAKPLHDFSMESFGASAVQSISRLLSAGMDQASLPAPELPQMNTSDRGLEACILRLKQKIFNIETCSEDEKETSSFVCPESNSFANLGSLEDIGSSLGSQMSRPSSTTGQAQVYNSS